MRILFIGIVAALAFALAPGCSERPQDGLDELLAALQKSDEEAAWARFDRASRRMLEDEAARLQAAGAIDGSAREHLARGFLPRGVDRIELVSREDDLATLDMIDFDGKKQRVQMRFEDDAWRLHLPGAD